MRAVGYTFNYIMKALITLRQPYVISFCKLVPKLNPPPKKNNNMRINLELTVLFSECKK